MNTIIQGLGYFGTFLLVVSWQSRHRDRILLLQIGGLLALGAHLFMIQAYTGAVAVLICGIRNVIFHKKEFSEWANHKYWPWIIIAVLTVMVGVTWEGMESLLPLAGTIFGTYAIWQDSPSRMRIFSILTVPPWVTYYMINDSIPGIIVCGFILLSILSGIIRLDMHSKSAKKSVVNL